MPERVTVFPSPALASEKVPVAVTESLPLSDIKYHKEQWALKGWARKQYERKHIPELAYYDSYRSTLKNMIKGEDKRILPKTWRKELDRLCADFDKTETPYSRVVTQLACCEVLAYNKKELARLIENESHRRARDISLTRRNQPSL